MRMLWCLLRAEHPISLLAIHCFGKVGIVSSFSLTIRNPSQPPQGRLWRRSPLFLLGRPAAFTRKSEYQAPILQASCLIWVVLRLDLEIPLIHGHKRPSSGTYLYVGVAGSGKDRRSLDWGCTAPNCASPPPPAPGKAVASRFVAPSHPTVVTLPVLNLLSTLIHFFRLTHFVITSTFIYRSSLNDCRTTSY